MNDNQFLVLVGLGVLGLWMLSNPRCNTGCKTVAEHLLTHVIDDMLGGLLAA